MRSRKRTGLRSRAGFTLLEVVVVLTILGSMMAVAMPAFQGAQRSARASNGAQQLISDLRQARAEAMRRNAAVEFTRTGPSTYTIDHIGGRTLPEGVTFHSGPTTVRFSAFGPVLSGAGVFTLLATTSTVSVRVTASGHPQPQ